MSKQAEFGWVKDIPIKKVPCMGLVRFELSYAVDLNDEAMVEHAKQCLYEDIMAMVKYDETFNGIRVEENNDVEYDDIPEFLLGERDMEE